MYIKSRKAFVEQAKSEYQSFLSDSKLQGKMKEMSAEEKTELIKGLNLQNINENVSIFILGLKQHWEKLNVEYQKLSVIMDMLSKRAKKENLEYKMELIEKDIEFLEKHQIIYVTE